MVDELVMPRLPTMDDKLKEIVKSQMTHSPCGPDSRSPCMQNGRCSKGFPKRWCEETVLADGSYPEYARPRDGQTWGTERFTFDNRWVVPFNPYLSKKYAAHINVEVAKGVHAIKYLAKYVYKGSDRATLSIGDRYDEIAMTIQGRYISPVQAVWRLFEYTTHQEKPAVKILPYHLQGYHQVIFNANMSPSEVEAAAQSQSSPFLDWMSYNTRNTDGRDLLYSDFPLFFVHDRNQGWRKRVKGQQIGRMSVAYPSQRERFHLRMLLTVKRGVQSYEDLYTVEGHRYDNPTSACLALGLIADDSEWGDFLDQIKDTASAGSLRQTFASIVANATVINPQGLWDNFKDFLTDDCLYWISVMGDSLNLPPADWTAQQSRYDYGLWLLGERLGEVNKDWPDLNMIGPEHNWTHIPQERNPLIREILRAYGDEDMRNFENSINSFSLGQRNAYETIITTIDNGRRPNTFFLQGPAGTSKTFLYKTLCTYYRSRGELVLCVASSGIAALLLPDGRTAHSQFKIPLNSDGDSQCRIAGTSDLAELLRRVKLIIWDEVTLQNKFDFGAVDKVLKCLRHSTELFGGVPVVLGGDFAQILPVVKGGHREQFVSACIRNWSEWPLIQPLFLTQNMRLLQGEENQRFAEWLSMISYERRFYGSIDLPSFIITTDNRDRFRDLIFPSALLQSGQTDIFKDRAILSSRNDLVESFNNEIASLRTAASREYLSRDEIEDANADHISDYPSDFLLTLSSSGLPQGILKLQVGMPVMLLRNLYPKLGLCNGTRLIVRQLYRSGVLAEIVSSDPRFNGEKHFIHKIPVTSSEGLPFTLIRHQLPLRPCFAMTINKSQGQTLQRVAVDLSTPVFSHGQFYVALSRVTNVSSMIVLLPSGSSKTENVVYEEVLLRP